ncbi:50S ribosomal protein L5 [Candidatus Roizmanbacteria bacterium RIFCSPHIGHO2_02_FULL_40_9]|uniref:Large ribosomal subunit protein uL5 n=2 Tax=Candidatus Roizmaniibacteriota TaxID=1752723 RepID=A0A1F7IKX1_9BACT|nr:MAG: 50S ribosomal protein L5 [Candidatus Roizmanbacteria bacterium RIFCSPHIGHO2_02_FULL_40_9]OGK44018.1 MAG: 50S ribosomal protein L5 [Candidatus Roizmanbacteria bacterium RIFCSPLOWO2_01_FULL_38_11]
MKFKEHYQKEIVGELKKELGLNNVYAVPQVKKVIINVGCGEAAADKKIIERVVGDITLISGQKAMITKARNSVSAFKIRKGLPIGVKVTLRGKRMYNFLEKLFKIVFPRIRDFKGIPVKNFDGQGNLNIGLSDQTLFPEIEYDKIDKIRGLEITIVTTARVDDHAQKLLEKLGLVFEKEK